MQIGQKISQKFPELFPTMGTTDLRKRFPEFDIYLIRNT